MICRHWRPVPYHLYGRVRLAALHPHRRPVLLRRPPQRTHRRSWDDPRQPTSRTWTCNGKLDDGQDHGVTLHASYDVARTRGWRIHLHHGHIDAMCPDCARPDPITVALCRDLERSVHR